MARCLEFSPGEDGHIVFDNIGSLIPVYTLPSKTPPAVHARVHFISSGDLNNLKIKCDVSGPKDVAEDNSTKKLRVWSTTLVWNEIGARQIIKGDNEWGFHIEAFVDVD